MYFVEKVLGQLFPSRELDRQFTSVSEIGRRSLGQRRAYVEWERTGGYKLMNASVMATYYETEPPARCFTDVNLFRTESACGFTLVFKADGEVGARHYVDFLRDRLFTLGYHPLHAYCEMRDQNRYVETTEKYFFRQDNRAEKRDAAQQDVGSDLNIEGIDLAYVCNDNVPSHCKVMVLIDTRQRCDSLVIFNQLMDKLFGF